MPAASAPGVLGSSPAQRSGAQKGSARSTVLPFVRPANRPSTENPQLGSSSGSSYKRQAFDLASRNYEQQRVDSPGRSAPAGGLPRRPDVSPLQRSVGFEPAAVSKPAVRRPPTSPSPPARAGSLLTRQLSQETGSPGSGHSLASQAATDIQRKLEKCLQKDAAQPAGEGPALAHSAAPQLQQLRELQARHAVFHAPVVVRAFGIASAVVLPDSLEANTATARILADLGLDADAVAAALLHNTLDVSPLTRPQLEALAPQPVAEMVANVSRINGACQLLQADRSAQDPGTAAKLTTMLLAMADVRAVLIVLASRLQRLRSAAAKAAAGGTDLRAEAQEGLAVFAPLANRLGVWSLKAELEDLCFLVLNPARAKELRDALAEPQSRSGLAAALSQLKVTLDAGGLAYQDLSGRPKNLYSVHSKLGRKTGTAAAAAGHSALDISQIYDVRALRLVVDSKQDCYAALRAVETLWTPIPSRFKDYIRNPKANGYQSLHTVVTGPDGLPIEVQIRTAKMHYIAEYGVAAHWRYKEAMSDASAHTERLIGWARWLITWQLELEDGKTRPHGSPPRDTSLAALFGGNTAGRAVGPAAHGEHQAAGGGGTCTFPEHAPDCRFAKFVHSERFASRAAPDHLSSPVYILLMNGAEGAAAARPSPDKERAAAAAQSSSLVRSLSNTLDPLTAPDAPPLQPLPRIQEVPAGTTVAAILAGSVPALGLAAAAAPRLRVLVNHEEVIDPHTMLRHGDKVEIFDAEPAQAPASNVLPFRRKLTLSGELPAAGSPAGGSGVAVGQPGPPLAEALPSAAAPAARGVPVLAARPSPPAGFDDESRFLTASSPLDETLDARRERVDGQRRMLDRAFSREPSAGLEDLVLRRPPSTTPHGEPVAS